MKKLIAFALSIAACLPASVAFAADFGDSAPPPPEAYAEPLPAPAIIDRPYNNYYAENGYYYASPYPLPYFGLFADRGPQYNFYHVPYWRVGFGGRGWGRHRARRYGRR
jgi:hypothetical protein